MKTAWVSILVALSLAGAACSKDKSGSTPGPVGAKDEHARDETTKGGHAEASVTPGSYADWCGEHGVPESQCTKCNPDLIAAFKATNDWCAEHGVPESQCLKCNPGLKIVRPPETH